MLLPLILGRRLRCLKSRESGVKIPETLALRPRDSAKDLVLLFAASASQEKSLSCRPIVRPETIIWQVWYQRLWPPRVRHSGGVTQSSEVSHRRRPKVRMETLSLWLESPTWHNLDRRLWALMLETSAQVDQQQSLFVGIYIKPYSSPRRGCDFHSLNFIDEKLNFTWSPTLATRTWYPFVGFEGADLDLGVHQRNLNFISIS
jgi:hypothetical protein